MKNAFLPDGALIPRGTDLQKWSVVACDQYTSEPVYWERVQQFVGDSPSTLRLTLPEIYLNSDDVAQRIKSLQDSMSDYLNSGLLSPAGDGYILVEREMENGAVRWGLVGRLDLEAYDFAVDSAPAVRATEGTVVERIPPRMMVRNDAMLELPHVMLLVDDAEMSIIERAARDASRYEVLYDTELMERGGHLRGYLLPSDETMRVEQELGRVFERPLALAVGDGNHSLATAKSCWEVIKPTLSPELMDNHPARFALCELVNVHSSALEFEPIHRVITNIDAAKFAACFCSEAQDGEEFCVVTEYGTVVHRAPKDALAVGYVQEIIDRFISANGGEVDYIHGDDIAKSLGSTPNSAAVLLPVMDKSELFRYVERFGALPRKTFSMGHAHEKRFYFEARKIK